MPVGWEPDDDGFRGYVFATEDNSTVVLTIKGTSIPLIGGGPTIEKDKLNDNLLFSCCCARVSSGWSPVCDCFRGDWKCNQECVESALIDDSLFYPTGVVRTPFSPRGSSPLTIGKTELVQQHHRDVSQREYMDYWPLARRCACFALRSHVRRARRGVRAARRSHGRATLAPAISRTLSVPVRVFRV